MEEDEEDKTSLLVFHQIVFIINRFGIRSQSLLQGHHEKACKQKMNFLRVELYAKKELKQAYWLAC